MLAIEHVVVPFDFSKRCRLAAEHAAAIARRFEARLIFVHVIPYSSYDYAAFEGGAYVGPVWPAEPEIRSKLEGEIAAILGLDTAGWEAVVEKGDPPGKIEEVVSRLSAPMIVIPTHGFGAFRRFLLGSVTTKILHDLDCPVYTGAHIEEGPIFSKGEARHVACAIDLGEHSRATLSWAAEYARHWAAKLTVIHAVNWVEGSPLDEKYFTAELDRRLVAGAEREALSLIASVGCEADLQIGIESAVEFVPRVVEATGADVLVIGRSLERATIGRLREHAYALIRESPVPVISV
jgi:nucleotide-binding universal stress UspA family protein